MSTISIFSLPNNKRKTRLIEFTLLQLLQHNIQLGAAINFSLLSSHWFIFGVRHKFTIINLSQTVLHYRYFLQVIRYSTLSRRHVLFVNERRHAHVVVSDIATSIGEAYVMGRWVGGTITNFKKIWLMYHRLLRFKHNSTLSSFRLTLKNSLRGIMILRALPAVIFFNSVKHSYCATGEAYALHIPSGGVTDSDALPDSVLYPIPGNDDAFGSLYFLNKLIAKMVLLSKIETMLKFYTTFCEKMAKWALRDERAKRRQKNKHRNKRYSNNGRQSAAGASSQKKIV